MEKWILTVRRDFFAEKMKKGGEEWRGRKRGKRVGNENWVKWRIGEINDLDLK